MLDRPPTARDAEPAIVVSTAEERRQWERLAKLPLVVVMRVDHLLDGVLQQRLDDTGGRLA